MRRIFNYFIPVLALTAFLASCKKTSASPSRAWVVSTLAGSSYGHEDDTGANAQFREPYGVAVDLIGNIYVADQDNHRIRKIEYRVAP